MSKNNRIRHRARRAVEPEATPPAEPAPESVTGERAYEVGFGKPPKHTRFKSGQSGNPKGRPKHDKNLITAVDRAMSVKVNIRDELGQRRVTKREAIATQLVNKAVKGDNRSTDQLLKIDDKLAAAIKEAARDQAAAPSAEALDANEKEIFAELKQLVSDELGELAGAQPEPRERTPKDEE